VRELTTAASKGREHQGDPHHREETMVERQKMVGGDVKQRRHYVLDGRELGARK
jgi:hypothetical protein